MTRYTSELYSEVYRFLRVKLVQRQVNSYDVLEK